MNFKFSLSLFSMLVIANCLKNIFFLLCSFAIKFCAIYRCGNWCMLRESLCLLMAIRTTERGFSSFFLSLFLIIASSLLSSTRTNLARNSLLIAFFTRYQAKCLSLVSYSTQKTRYQSSQCSVTKISSSCDWYAM